MKKLLALPILLFFSPLAAEAQLNPYQIGMQYCQMVNSGLSRKKAWNYIVDNIATNAVNNAYSSSGDPFAPWSPRRSLGGSLGFGIGTGISQGIMVGTQLRRMKPDIERVIQNNCPAGYSRPSTSTSEAFDKSSPSYCNWNPWEAACKDGSLQRSKAQESCLQVLIKYDCKYMKYLEANPHMKDWVKANPEMARKEALRLKAIDADEIGSAETPKSEHAADSGADKSKEEKCLKAADYKGCMEYHGSN